MVNAPPDYVVEAARKAALKSPCQKSKRGVVLFDPGQHDTAVHIMEMYSSPTGAHLTRAGFSEAGYEIRDRMVIAGSGFNGPPPGFLCDGSQECRADCSKFCLHAEHRAISAAGILDDVHDLELVHVKVVDGQVIEGGPPSCWQCSREIVDVGLKGVWLFEQPIDRTAYAGWRYYTAHDFHCATLVHCGIAGVPT